MIFIFSVFLPSFDMSLHYFDLGKICKVSVKNKEVASDRVYHKYFSGCLFLLGSQISSDASFQTVSL